MPRGSVFFFLLWPLSFADFLFLPQRALASWELTLGWGKRGGDLFTALPGLWQLA